MKTSKIIFVTLLITIAVFIIAVFIDKRFNGIRRADNSYEITLHKQIIPSFKVLYAVNCKNIRIVQSDSNFVELAWKKDSIPPEINYRLINDTLVITNIRFLIQRSGFQPVRIHTTNSLRTIASKDSELAIEIYNFSNLSANLDNSSAWFSQKKSKNAYYSNLEITAKNKSVANTNDFAVDTLSIFLQNSISNSQILAKKIYVTLSDSSTIVFPQPNEIYLKRDSTSRFIIK
jgi:hypothetical protein